MIISLRPNKFVQSVFHQILLTANYLYTLSITFLIVALNTVALNLVNAFLYSFDQTNLEIESDDVISSDDGSCHRESEMLAVPQKLVSKLCFIIL